MPFNPTAIIQGFGVPGIPNPAGYFIVSLYKLPGLDSYAGGISSAGVGRNPSVTMKALALKEELVDVDQRLCDTLEELGMGGGGRLPPERTDSVSLLASVMPPQDEDCELVLAVRVLRVEPGREEAREGVY